MDAYDYYINGVNFESLCRICAHPADRLIPIFKGEGKEFFLGDKIKDILQITVSCDDDLPQCICCNCSFQIMSWYDLKLTAVKTEQQLRQLHEFIEGDSNERSMSPKNYSKEPKELPKLRLKKKPKNYREYEIELPIKSEELDIIDLINEEDQDASQDFHLKFETDVFTNDTDETEQIYRSISEENVKPMSIQLKRKSIVTTKNPKQSSSQESKTVTTKSQNENDDICNLQFNNDLPLDNLNVSSTTKSPKRNNRQSNMEEKVKPNEKSKTIKETEKQNSDDKESSSLRNTPSRRKSEASNKTVQLEDTVQNVSSNEIKLTPKAKTLISDTLLKKIAESVPENVTPKNAEGIKNISKEIDATKTRKRKSTDPRKRDVNDTLHVVEVEQQFMVQGPDPCSKIPAVNDTPKNAVRNTPVVSRNTITEWDLWESAAHELELMRRNLIPSAEKAKIKAAAKKTQEESKEVSKIKEQLLSPKRTDLKTPSNETNTTNDEKTSMKQHSKKSVTSNEAISVKNLEKSRKSVQDNISKKIKFPKKDNSSVKNKTQEKTNKPADKPSVANQSKRTRYIGPVTGDIEEMNDTWSEAEYDDDLDVDDVDTTPVMVKSVAVVNKSKDDTKAMRPKTELARIKQESLRYGRRISRRVVRVPEKFASATKQSTKKLYSSSPKETTTKPKEKKVRIDWKIDLSNSEKTVPTPNIPNPMPVTPKIENTFEDKSEQSHLYTQLKGYGCIYCPETFHRATELRKHLEMHEKNEENLDSNKAKQNTPRPKPPSNRSIVHVYPRKCENCSRTYSCRQSFDKHLRLKVCERPIGVRYIRSVRNTFPYSRMCENCHAIYHSRQSFWKHLKSNTCNSTRRLPCFHPNCSIVVYHKRQMAEHLRIHHGLSLT